VSNSNTPKVDLSWDASLRTVVIVWEGFNEAGSFRPIMERVLEMMKSKGASRMLADLRDAKVNSPEDQKWLYEDWMPRAIQAGLRSMALVVPKSTIAQLGLRRSIQRIDKNDFLTAHLEDVKGARKWLKSQPR
jgi:hypothetical protein